MAAGPRRRRVRAQVPARARPSRGRCSPRSRSRSRSRPGATRWRTAAPGKGNDQVRFELTYKALAPQLPVIAPWREWDIVSREDAIDYAAKHKVPIAQTTKKIYSRDRNIWHISHEGGALEDPANAAPDDIWMLTQSPKEAPNKPGGRDHRLRSRAAGFGQRQDMMSGVALLEQLNEIGGEHGIGRIDLVENRFVGMKSRGCYETPGGTLIMAAHRELEALTLDKNTRTTSRSSRSITPRWSTTACGSRRCASRSTPSSKASARTPPAR